MNSPSIARQDGALLAALYTAGLERLTRHVVRVDALNVFPVPDGDTGTNMRLTLLAAVQSLGGTPPTHVGEAAQIAAQAALLGARGNSGLILSQILAGFAHAFRGNQTFSVTDFAQAWAEAAQRVYRAVEKPVEGTMLTVVREIAEAVAKDGRDASDLGAALQVACSVAASVVVRTPSMMPRLREAGVVDAGAEGLRVVLDGMSRHLLGQPVDDGAPDDLVRPRAEAMAEAAHTLDDHGYCTNFAVLGASSDVTRFRTEMLGLGTSVVVAGTADVLKVHLHTDHPGLALEAGARWGDLTAIEITNMRQQYAARQSADALPDHMREQVSERSPAAVVAVVPSESLAQVFAGLKAFTVLGGQSMNPSVGQLVGAIRQANAQHVFVLPNNGNVVATAQEAAKQSNGAVTVIPSVTIPEGVAAAVAFLADRAPSENAEKMEAALPTVTSIEVTRATRNARMDSQDIAAGQNIALIGGEIVAVACGPVAAAIEAVRVALREEHSVITVYVGAGMADQDVSALTERLSEVAPSLQTEVVMGAQPHYPFILALE